MTDRAGSSQPRPATEKVPQPLRPDRACKRSLGIAPVGADRIEGERWVIDSGFDRTMRGNGTNHDVTSADLRAY